MSKQFAAFEPAHRRFVAEQPIFFVATAAPDGRINLSPKGMDSLRILGPGRLVWLNLTGSGNETAAHLAESPRMTVMWCSFGTRPMILRAYGTARVVHHGAEGWADLAGLLPATPGARQVVDMAVDLVQTSCGYAVPLMDLRAPRETLRDWAAKKGPEGVAAYWAEANRTSLDGRPTGIEAALPRPGR
jgi:hypothetical protein